MKKRNHREQKNPPILHFLELDQAKTAVTASLRSAGSRRCYEHAISEFIDWYCSEPRLGFNKAVVTRFRIYLESQNLAPGTVNLRLAAIRRLAYEAADAGLLSPEQAAAIRRVKGAKKLGVRVGNWLLAKEARALWELPNVKTLKGKRDRATQLVPRNCVHRHSFTWTYSRLYVEVRAFINRLLPHSVLSEPMRPKGTATATHLD